MAEAKNMYEYFLTHFFHFLFCFLENSLFLFLVEEFLRKTACSLEDNFFFFSGVLSSIKLVHCHSTCFKRIVHSEPPKYKWLPYNKGFIYFFHFASFHIIQLSLGIKH